MARRSKAVATRATVQVEGLRELQRAFRRIDKDLPKELRKNAKAAAEIVARQGKIEAPERSGKLARSIKAQANQKGGRVKGGTPTRVPYAAAIHWGWPSRNIEPNKFLIRALERTGRQVGELFAEGVKDLTNKAMTRARRFPLR